MSEDPETARQIAELSLDTRPLLVLDVDDVLMEFVRPFMLFLDAQGLELTLATFRLHGNIRDKKTGEALDREPVSALIDGFFAVQAEWQTPLEGAVGAIAELARQAEIVMLTAMPHRHRATRRAHLDRLGFPYPLLTTETAKGPAIRELRGMTARPVAFVDDIPHNLVSVRAAVSEAHLFHLMALPQMRSLLPPLPEQIEIVDDWREAEPRIAAALGI
ncbi:hypothetical protein [Mesorhizobium sp. CN2-181]|uniref:hypothetical protein n=1 Tax=Mesorhizobium yinganensis TaxID=3157707 RepID=UPI0032B82B38